MDKKELLTLILLFFCPLTAFCSAECPDITLTAEPSPVSVTDESVAILYTVPKEYSSVNYTWYRDGEEMEWGQMSLGQTEIVYVDYDIPSKPCEIKYQLNITNKQCDVTGEITIAVTDPSGVTEASATTAATRYYNLTGAEVYEPLPSGVYIVKEGVKSYKIVR